MKLAGGSRRRGIFARLARDRRGSTVVIFALTLPVLALLACGAVDLSALYGDKSRMQDVADSTALMAAKQLGTATAVGISARAQQYALDQLADISSTVALTVTTTLSSNNAQVTVAINGQKQSFFANLLPPGGWSINVQSTAATLGQVPLCVLATGSQNNDGITLNASSKLTANNCMTQSDDNITVTGSAQLAAGVVDAVGTAKGAITPSAQTGAAPIADPFASMSITLPSPTCASSENVTYLTTGINTLAPGEHCGNFTVQSGASLVLEPGEHYFVNGSLQMQGTSILSGNDVVLVFDQTSNFNFTGQSVIDLSGRLTGPYAGFVIATTRTNTQDFNITSDNAEQLLGTVYIPSAKLHLNGSGNQIAQLSAWTVVVANAIETDGSAELVVNSNYAATKVPVPAGVGPTSAGQIVLTH